MTKPKYRGPLLATVAGDPMLSSMPSTSIAARPAGGSSKSSSAEPRDGFRVRRDRPVGDAAQVGERPVEGIVQQLGSSREHGLDVHCVLSHASLPLLHP